MRSFFPVWTLALAVMVSLTFVGCTSPKPWPQSPLYETPVNDPNWNPPATRKEAMEAMAGHYAHYDVVAYYSVLQRGQIEVRRNRVRVDGGEVVEVPFWLDTAAR